MDNWNELNIRLQVESLITEREGMIAENQQRLHGGESMAYVEENFRVLITEFTRLREELIRHG